MKKILVLAILGTVVSILTIGFPLATSANPSPPAIVFELLCPGSVEIEPQTAGGNLVKCFDVPGPTETPTPTDTPIPATATPVPPIPTVLVLDCSLVPMVHVSGLTPLSSYSITNNSAGTVTATGGSVSWAGTGLLTSVVFDGVVLQDFGAGVSAVAQIDNITSAIVDRQLSAGGTVVVELNFSGQVLAITFALQLDNQCFTSASV